MDIGLPILSGIEVTRKIRESLDNLNKESVIIALTAHDSIDAKDECLKVGMSDFLVKPLNVEKIQDIVQKWFAIQDFAENIQKIAKTESNAAEKNKEHIDFNLAKQLANADEHLALELLRLLVKELPEYKTTINKAYNAKDLERLTKITHKLNGSAGYCGTVKLKKYAKILEQYANVNDYVKIKIYLDKLNKEIDAVIEASQEFVSL
jgi:CheY-like chemotaxis protein